MEFSYKKAIVPQQDVMAVLDSCYKKCLNGIPKVSPNIEDMANDYLRKYATKELACQAMLKNQITKCATSGFITGFGGIVTMPVTIPANVTSVLYVQMRMIACTAYMAGFELDSDETQTFVYACLAGVTVNELVKGYSVKLGVKFANELIKKIPGEALREVNKKVGFRLLTKYGETGVVNLAKLLPGVGAVVGGGVNLVETKIIAKRSYKWFFKHDFSVDSKNKDGIKIYESNLERNV